jgi:hypothetical protein
MLAEPWRLHVSGTPTEYVQLVSRLCVGGIVHRLQFEAMFAVVMGFVVLVGVVVIGLLHAVTI